MNTAPTTDADPDRGLVLACQDALREGRTAPFDELYELYHVRVYRQCLRKLRNECDAHDACQDAFHHVLLGLSTFQHHARFGAWLRNVVRNCCRDLLRRRLARRPHWLVRGVDAELEPADTSAESPATSLAEGEIRDRVAQSIARLSPPLRAVVALRYFAQCSYEEIALRLEISEGTVKSRLFRAHAALEYVLATRLDPDDLRGVA